MSNSVKLMGRLAGDPEVRYTKTGKAVASFSVAVTREYPGKQQTEKESADFIPVVVWGNLAEHCGNSLSKGQKVLVHGRLQVRSYETNDGQKRRVTEVVADFVGQSLDAQQTQPKDGFAAMGKDVTDDDQIPF